MPRYPKPPEGSWTEHFGLSTEPLSYADSISPEFYELEREAIFKRAWLNVGRVEQLPRNGSYFTKEIAVAKTSLILVRDGSEVRAFHNVCRHRGNKLVWQERPEDDVQGACREFACKYHGWRYGLDGQLKFVQQEGEFFDLDKTSTGLLEVHCDVWEGFVFVHLGEKPAQSLREFLGPMVTGLDGYPFDRMTTRFTYRAEIGSNWKLYMDAFQEFYHAPVLHQKQTPPAWSMPALEKGFEAPHYQVDGPHRLVSTAGIRLYELPENMRKPIEGLTRSGNFGPWEAPDLGEVPAGLNPGNCDPWGLDSFQMFPNFVILIWSLGWYLTYHYWPTSYNTHVFESTLYFVPPKTARERIALEMAAVTFKEYGLQDANTLEATQRMLESQAVTTFPLCDQEVLCRHLHHVTKEWVESYIQERQIVA